jgi:hypothetical protein
VLNLRDGKEAVQFLFENGRIAGLAFPADTAETSPLGKRLVRGGLLAEESWKKAFAEHREALVDVESVLLKNRLVRQEDLEAVLRLLISETLYGLFKWNGGNFRFEGRESVGASHLSEPLNAEFLLLDVLRMVDEWPLLSERIPSSRLVLKKANETATLEVLAGSAWADKRSFQMEVIYELINGQRTVGDIVDQSFVGEFETCKNLMTLMEAGVIEPLGLNPKAERRNGGRFGKVLKKAGAVLLVGGLSLALGFQLAGIRGGTFPLSPQEYEGWSKLRGPAEKMGTRKRENAAEVFRVEKNRNPRDVSELVKTGLLSRGALQAEGSKP